MTYTEIYSLMTDKKKENSRGVLRYTQRQLRHLLSKSAFLIPTPNISVAEMDIFLLKG